MEEALQKSEEYYRTIFEKSSTAMIIVDEDGLVSIVNSESEALFGRPPQEIEGKMRWDEFIAEKDREKLWELFRKGQRKLKTTTAQHEADLIDRWGGVKRGLFWASIIPRTRQYVVSVTNITEQKRMEEALRKSEEKYRTLVEDQTDLICRFLPDGTLTFVNEAYCRYFGRVRDGLVGQSFMSLIPEEDQQKVRDKMASLSKDRPVATCVHRVSLPNGEVRWQQWTDRAILDERGEVFEFQSSGQDITERKLAEEALKENEERLKMAVDGANLGIWDWNLVTGEEIFNEKWAEILGYSFHELKDHLGIWDQLVHPEDRLNVKKALQDHLDGLTSHCEMEHRMRSKDGRWVWIHGRGKVVSRDETGRPMRMTGVIQDITEIRKFQKALLETTKS
ncbi:MAG TPA: PAS domain S-box protein [Methanotrichaceae archaeon]|nr:PAS domain S-box protein [Methanotrichaceae archaeon]